MSARIISATRRPEGYHLRVHLDENELVSEAEAEGLGLEPGEAHPTYIREWVWGHPHAQHQGTEADYLDSLERMLKENVANELAAIRSSQTAPPPEVIDRLHGKEL